MSYDMALSLLFVLIISAGALLVLRRRRLRRRQARADQADLAAIFASHKNDSSQSFS